MQGKGLLWFTMAVSVVCLRAAHAEPGHGAHHEPNRSARLIYKTDVAECPSERELRDGVLARLGYDPFTPKATRTVTAVIERSRGGLRARVDLQDASEVKGSRTIESAKSDCSELASAMLLAITIAIDPTSLTRPPPPPPVHPVETAPPPPPTEAPTAEQPSARPDGGEGVRPVLGALGGTGFGLTPGISFAPRVLFGIESEHFALDVEGRFYLPTTAAARPRAVRASLLVGTIAPCYRAPIAAELGIVGRACGVFMAGRMAGRGAGVDVALEDASFYAAVGPRVALELGVSRSVAFVVQSELLTPLVDTRLRLGVTDIWTSPSVVADIALGAIARLP